MRKRYSCYDDEYHKFSKIHPKDLIAIKITENEEDFGRHIEHIFDILEEYGMEIPLIDNTLGISISRR